MPVRASAVGSESEALRLDVDVRMTQAYAAGIGDRNARYFDDAAPGGAVAPPAFCVSVEWPVFLALARLDALEASRDERLRGVHALQDSTFLRLVRPGDALESRARVVEVRSTRAGAYVGVRIDTRDARSGEPIVTSHYGSIYRGVGVTGSDARSDGIPPWPGPPPTGPAAVKVALRTVPEAAHVYTECARIWNPIHTERRVALEAGLPGIILHGTATWALAAREIVDRLAGGDPARLRRLSGEFRAMVIPGEAIEFEATLGADGQIAFVVRNARGDAAVANGRALLSPEGEL
jgi:acyl dehydratase